MLDNFPYPADIFPSARFYHEDMSEPPVVMHKSAEGIPSVKAFDTLPTPNPARLKSQTVQQATIG